MKKDCLKAGETNHPVGGLPVSDHQVVNHEVSIQMCLLTYTSKGAIVEVYQNIKTSNAKKAGTNMKQPVKEV